jgi:hypothetical protein
MPRKMPLPAIVPVHSREALLDTIMGAISLKRGRPSRSLRQAKAAAENEILHNRGRLLSYLWQRRHAA